MGSHVELSPQKITHISSLQVNCSVVPIIHNPHSRHPMDDVWGAFSELKSDLSSAAAILVH